MDEYPSVCYLDVPKTGSSFVSTFLAEHMNEPRLRFAKHGRIRDDHDPAKFYFISRRDPLAQYRSLFRFGQTGQGVLRRRLDKLGHGALYGEGAGRFADWLVFVLDPSNAATLTEDFGRLRPGLIGLQTFRFMSLAIPRPMRELRRVGARDEVRRLVARNSIAKAVVRTETLNADLARLVEGALGPFMKDAGRALDSLRQAQPINASGRPSVEEEAPAELVGRLREREWLLYEMDAAISG